MAPAEALSPPPVKDTLLPHGRFLVERAMRERGLSVTGLALRLGISRKHLSNVLNAKVPLGDELADRIAAALRLAPTHVRILRHDGVIPGKPRVGTPFAVTVLGDPREPIPDWFQT